MTLTGIQPYMTGATYQTGKGSEKSVPAAPAAAEPGDPSGLADAPVQGGVPVVPYASSDGTQQSGADGKQNRDSFECQTCKNRKYKDGSDDPGVSYKTPTAISPEKAASAVRSHEQEHVTRERAAASREGREVVNQTVTYHTSICPECGRTYVSGGTTRTVTQKQVDQAYGLGQEEKGKYLDKTA